MAWRPTEYLLEGELDNTVPGKVTGWMRFAGMDQKVVFDLKGDFHRDIRGAKIRFKGDGYEGSPRAAAYMDGFAVRQTGKVGDITAGLPPRDYVSYPYIEWYSEANGRVVIELSPDQVEVVGRPIPACESEPVSREQQRMRMARHIAELSRAAKAPVVAPMQSVGSDPSFTHWVIEDGRIIGEARSVEPGNNGVSFAFVKLFNRPETAKYRQIETCQLQAKSGQEG